MRCLSCNCQLTDHEATRKYAVSRMFIDLCNRCFADVADDIDYVDGNPPDDHELENPDEDFM